MTDIFGTTPNPDDFVAANGRSIKSLNFQGADQVYPWAVVYDDDTWRTVTAAGFVDKGERHDPYNVVRRAEETPTSPAHE